ncbi:LysR substrate-binding domain-containing protein [Blastomonas aquatica]|uniref:Nodulation protein D 2 n=1 Tax=Blastomonas aquatica TaxID=1510276 RepID=A0ABQ1J2D8_9SPHN|nr:LysR substrate-binding domain-containing protein [Blastomonas aquatica]GGB56141.1 nodulation protein D 2 [Blastomonas aquatica]
MRFKGLDLNLLVALDVLLEEQNVSRAAERMHVGQSAMSAALSRLRHHFEDDLLMVTGRRMVPTALADSMRQPLRDAILHIESVVEIERTFIPSTSTRTFTIEMPDHLVPVILPALMRRMSDEAPRIVLEVSRPVGDPSPLLHKGELDLVLTPNIYSDPAYVTEQLVRNELVLVGWRDNPALQTQPDLATVMTLQQAIVKFDRVRLASILSEQQLAIYGGSGRVALVAPNFSCIPPSLVGTSMVAVLNRRLVNAAARDLPLAVWEVPVAMPSMMDVMMFHPMRRQDNGLAWLRDQLREAVAEMGT